MKSINLLDPAQKTTLEALTNDESANDLSIVYGPPGTGKSHLITSLLFELAIRDKKVLFVSQNTEALKVIERMYEKLDKEMHKSKNDLCFLDFCLRLDDPACRKAKYLKEHKSVIMAQKNAPFMRFSTNEEEQEELNEPPYALSYRYLRQELNNDSGDSGDSGVDELLLYQMKFINDESMANDVVYGVDSISIREVFELLDGYRHGEIFKALVRPDDQLKYLRRDNLTISLTDLRTESNTILSNLFSLPDDKSYQVKSVTNITDYLNDLKIINEWWKYVKVDKLESDPSAVTKIIECIKRAEKVRGKKKDCPVIEVDDYDFVFDKNVKAILSNRETVQELIEVSETAKWFSTKLKESGKKIEYDKDVYSIEQIVSYALGAIGLKDSYSNMTMAAPGLANCTSEDIDNIVKEIEDWSSDVGIFGKKRPKGKLGQITEWDKSGAAYLEENEGFLIYLSELLKDTNYCVDYLAEESKKRVKMNIYRPINVNKLSDRTYLSFLNLLIRLHEKEWCNDCRSINEVVERLDLLVLAADFVARNLKKNKEKFSAIDEVIEVLSDNMANHKIDCEVAEIVKECSPYMSNPDMDIHDFLQGVSDIELRKFEEVSGRLEHFVGPIGVETDKIVQLAKTMSDKQVDVGYQPVFCSEFFEILPGGNINSLVNRCSTILAFSDVDKLIAFTEHNDFIERLKNILKDEHNRKLIDCYLDLELEYDAFCSYVANAILQSKIGMIGVKSAFQKKYGKEYLRQYKSGNFIDRASHYDRGLLRLKNNYENPSMKLTQDINSTTGMHNIERFRKCTSSIVGAFPVIIATPAEVSKYLDAKELFDYVVFDEASQLLPGQALPSLYRAQRAIVVGDPHQMPPSLTTAIGFNDDEDDEENLEEFGQSILDMIKGLQTAAEYHLTTHYRSESNQLFEPSRKAIYEEEGIQPIFEAQSERMPIFISDGLGDGNEQGFEKIIQRMRYYLSSDPETSFCLLFSRGDDRGLYAFRKYFDKNGTKLQDIAQLYDEGRLLLSTIKDCQGIEGDHTILYLPHYSSIGQMWFFKEKVGAYKRLNVAVTRQRKTLDLIMGDSRGRWLSECQRMLSDPVGPNQEKSARLFTTLLSKAGQEIDAEYLDKELKPNESMIDSPLAEELYRKLCEHYKDRIGEDLHIWCEVGYKLVIPTSDMVIKNQESIGFRIDIGVYSVKHRKFVLGIEMDGSTYHSGFIREFSDIQRQEVLEMKGWNIYRIWSTNWLKNKKEEFDSLTREIDMLLDLPVEEGRIDTSIEEVNNNSREEEESSNSDPSELPQVTIKERGDDTRDFENGLLAICRKAKKNGTYVRIMREGAPEFEELLINDISNNLDYILARYKPTESFFKIDLKRIVKYIEEK